MIFASLMFIKKQRTIAYAHTLYNWYDFMTFYMYVNSFDCSKRSYVFDRIYIQQHFDNKPIIRIVNIMLPNIRRERDKHFVNSANIKYWLSPKKITNDCDTTDQSPIIKFSFPLRKNRIFPHFNRIACFLCNQIWKPTIWADPFPSGVKWVEFPTRLLT